MVLACFTGRVFRLKNRGMIRDVGVREGFLCRVYGWVWAQIVMLFLAKVGLGVRMFITYRSKFSLARETVPCLLFAALGERYWLEDFPKMWVCCAC